MTFHSPSNPLPLHLPAPLAMPFQHPSNPLPMGWPTIPHTPLCLSAPLAARKRIGKGGNSAAEWRTRHGDFSPHHLQKPWRVDGRDQRARSTTKGGAL